MQNDSCASDAGRRTSKHLAHNTVTSANVQYSGVAAGGAVVLYTRQYTATAANTFELHEALTP